MRLQKTEGYGLASFGCGLLSLILPAPIFAQILAIVGVLLGLYVMHMVPPHAKAQGRGFALTGMILGFAALLISIVMTVTLAGMGSIPAE